MIDQFSRVSPIWEMGRVSTIIKRGEKKGKIVA